jgi:hypothetical protein
MIRPKRLEVIGLFGFELFANITATAKKIQDYVDQAKAEGLVEKKDFVQKVLVDKRNAVDPINEFEYVFFYYFSSFEDRTIIN